MSYENGCPTTHFLFAGLLHETRKVSSFSLYELTMKLESPRRNCRKSQIIELCVVEMSRMCCSILRDVAKFARSDIACLSHFTPLLGAEHATTRPTNVPPGSPQVPVRGDVRCQQATAHARRPHVAGPRARAAFTGGKRSAATLQRNSRCPFSAV